MTPTVTADALLRIEGRFELIDGVVREMTASGYDHGRIAGNVHFHISSHVRERRLGSVCAAETGFILGRHPDTVRAPDVALVRRRCQPPLLWRLGRSALLESVHMAAPTGHGATGTTNACC